VSPQPSRRLRPLIASLLALALLLVAVPATLAGAAPKGGLPPQAKGPPPVELQILAINDFHGNLEPPGGSAGNLSIEGTTQLVGGVEYLATHVARLQEGKRNSIVVSAGDLIGATPLLSAAFHDEPTIEAMNTLGLDVNAVGNHEFDKGFRELLRMQDGGCHPVDGCRGSNPFLGADFEFLAANVVYADSGESILPEYTIHTYDGVRVAFIGMTLEDTPSIVTPSGVAGLEFRGEAATVNALVPKLQKRGIETIVVLVHEGGTPPAGSHFNACPSLGGAIVPIVKEMHPAVDAIVTGHTHQAYNCVIDGRPVTSAGHSGRLVTELTMTMDRRSKDVIEVTAVNRPVTRDVSKAPSLTQLIDHYKTIIEPIANRVIGSITADITRTANAAGESALGDVIADAQLAATSPAGTGNAVVAFMNPGGIRADLSYLSSPAGEGDGNVTYGESFAVQPFGNNLITMTVTGAQIDTLLEQQFGNPNVTSSRMLQVSDGFAYTWSASAPIGERVDPATIKIRGTVVDPAASYRITVNSFLADGGDNFFVLRQGTDRLGGVVDTQALEDYFVANSPVAPGPQNRITQQP
jgi:5'-nucleotidase